MPVEGTALIRPRYAVIETTREVLDVTFVVDAAAILQGDWPSADPSIRVSQLLLAKTILKDYVDNYLGTHDRMAIVSAGGSLYEVGTGSQPFIPDYERSRGQSREEIDAALSALTQLDAPFSFGDSNGKAALNAAIDSMSAKGGAAPGLGLERARRLISSSGRSTAIVDGWQANVRQVVVLLSGGMPQVYLNGALRRCDDGSAIAEHCPDELVGKGRPIGQLENLAQQLKDTLGERFDLYTFALSPQHDPAYLADVPSSSEQPFFTLVKRIEDYRASYNEFRGPALHTCIPHEEPLQPPIDPERLADDVLIGRVQFRNTESGAVYRSELFEQNGQAYYTLDLYPGRYEVSGYVRYRSLDGLLRHYQLSSFGGAPSTPLIAYIVESNLWVVHGPMLQFELNGSVCAAE